MGEEENSSRKVYVAGLRREGSWASRSRCLLGKGLGEPVTWSLAGLLDLEGILGPARIRPGHPSGLFPFANAGPAGPGGRWDCGGGEEQQAVSVGVSAVHRPWGAGRAGWARGS